MSNAELIELMREFVEHSDAAEDRRRRIVAALTNGAGPPEAARPFSPAFRRGPDRKAADEAEQTIVRLLADKPGTGTAAIARATGAKVNTTKARLQRLRARGAVAGGGPRGWTATSATATS